MNSIWVPLAVSAAYYLYYEFDLSYQNEKIMNAKLQVRESYLVWTHKLQAK